jgi:hypothetical protein
MRPADAAAAVFEVEDEVVEACTRAGRVTSLDNNQEM